MCIRAYAAGLEPHPRAAHRLLVNLSLDPVTGIPIAPGDDIPAAVACLIAVQAETAERVKLINQIGDVLGVDPTDDTVLLGGGDINPKAISKMSNQELTEWLALKGKTLEAVGT